MNSRDSKEAESLGLYSNYIWDTEEEGTVKMTSSFLSWIIRCMLMSFYQDGEH